MSHAKVIVQLSKVLLCLFPKYPNKTQLFPYSSYTRTNASSISLIQPPTRSFSSIYSVTKYLREFQIVSNIFSAADDSHQTTLCMLLPLLLLRRNQDLLSSLALLLSNTPRTTNALTLSLSPSHALAGYKWMSFATLGPQPLKHQQPTQTTRKQLAELVEEPRRRKRRQQQQS